MDQSNLEILPPLGGSEDAPEVSNSPAPAEAPAFEMEKTGAAAAEQPQSASPPPQYIPQAAAVPVAATNVPTNADDNSHTASLVADDADLIEKEWVEKAKQLVDKTKDDPYNQNKMMNVVKADYIKKRYGKDLKLAGD